MHGTFNSSEFHWVSKLLQSKVHNSFFIPHLLIMPIESLNINWWDFYDHVVLIFLKMISLLSWPKIFETTGTKYSRMDQVKFVEGSL